MESTDHTEGALSALPWVPVNIDGSKLLTKAWFGDTEYRLLLSDLNSVWEEEMSTDSIERRAQVLNKRLRAPVRAFCTRLRSVVWPCLSRQSDEESPAVRFLLKHEGDHLTVSLKSELGDVPLFWEFRCTPASVAVVCRELVCPFLSMTQVLHRHVGELTALLLKKDAEIQEYRENGAMLSRGRLQTEPFEEETYRRNFNQGLAAVVLKPGTSAEGNSLMESLPFKDLIHALATAQQNQHQSAGCPPKGARTTVRSLGAGPTGGPPGVPAPVCVGGAHERHRSGPSPPHPNQDGSARRSGSLPRALQASSVDVGLAGRPARSVPPPPADSCRCL
ncbi:non-homologous end-joining factor 1 isoform X1 [Neoarius graeffei]|uniref:non-homologous end-joining factor 1 isoform X1 n=1 Tax=Neoarius graeffei TaxID=443677 RepID=UPI00298CEA5A|nr:non-homologous end-joining factor 1 isoform X1 [Neoarius graeffei]XP_060775197.1 non-homologous end-joining factor 1 isoform X1 [Neoarius graeffei]